MADLDRLSFYRSQRAAEKERRDVAEVEFKRSLGHRLTDRDRAVLAYSQLGTAPACHVR